jgi:hypothetical protein
MKIIEGFLFPGQFHSAFITDYIRSCWEMRGAFVNDVAVDVRIPENSNIVYAAGVAYKAVGVFKSRPTNRLQCYFQGYRANDTNRPEERINQRGLVHVKSFCS